MTNVDRREPGAFGHHQPGLRRTSLHLAVGPWFRDRDARGLDSLDKRCRARRHGASGAYSVRRVGGVGCSCRRRRRGLVALGLGIATVHSAASVFAVLGVIVVSSSLSEIWTEHYHPSLPLRS